jgi:hypothetical protein
MRHSLIAVTPTQFEILGAQYSDGFRSLLGDQYTVEIETSWHIMYTFISKQIENYIASYRRDFDYERLTKSPVAAPPAESLEEKMT